MREARYDDVGVGLKERVQPVGGLTFSPPKARRWVWSMTHSKGPAKWVRSPFSFVALASPSKCSTDRWA